jgi:beta-glucosidase
MSKNTELKHKDLIESMTNEEKASLGSGADFWHTQPIKRLNMPSIMMTDGPHGLRKQKEKGDHIGINQSVPSTCFPTTATTANSWDRELMKHMGEALAKECPYCWVRASISNDHLCADAILNTSRKTPI